MVAFIMNVYHGIKALLKFDETTITHTTGKSKLKILSGPILRDTEQSITECHIENRQGLWPAREAKPRFGAGPEHSAHTIQYNMVY